MYGVEEPVRSEGGNEDGLPREAMPPTVCLLDVGRKIRELSQKKLRGFSVTSVIC